MNQLNQIITDLRDRRLWPLAALLVVALVAVPVLLSKSSSPTVSSVPPSSGASPGPAIPTVIRQVSPSPAKLTGPGRDPFAQAGTKTTATTTSKPGMSSQSGATTSTTKTSTTTGAPTRTPAVVVVVPVKSTSKKGNGKQSTSTSSTKSSTGLAPDESYDVSLAVSSTSRGLGAGSSLERLSVLPSAKAPVLVELGVLQGGKRVAFAVRPGAEVTGAGQCVPAGGTCEVVSVAPGQPELISWRTSYGPVPMAAFSVTHIGIKKHVSVAAADQARRAQSAAGRSLLDSISLPALSLFSYSPGHGFVIDHSHAGQG